MAANNKNTWKKQTVRFFKQKEKEILTKLNWQYYKCKTFFITEFSFILAYLEIY